MSHKKRLLALSILTASLLIGCNFDEEYVPRHVIVYDDENHCYNYSGGRVYIGDQDYLDNLEDINDNDILVLDAREDEDPDMKVYNSNKIINIDQIEEILEILTKYEEDNPSKWDRSITSMRNEWIYHNFSYLFNYKRNRTQDVDLNNDDESIYRKILIK